MDNLSDEIMEIIARKADFKMKIEDAFNTINVEFDEVQLEYLWALFTPQKDLEILRNDIINTLKQDET